MEEIVKKLADLTTAVNIGFRQTNENLDKLNGTVKDEGRKTRGLVGWNLFFTLLTLGLVIYCCFFNSGCNKVAEEKAVPCKLNTEMWVTGVGTINDPEALAALKGTDTIYLSFSKDDGERFKKVLTLANAYDAGKQIEYLIDFQKIDSVQNFCTFLVQDFRITNKALVQDTVKTISLPSVQAVPKSKAKMQEGFDPAPSEQKQSNASGSGLVEYDRSITGSTQAFIKMRDGSVKKRTLTLEDGTNKLLWENTANIVAVNTEIKSGDHVGVLVMNKLDSLFQQTTK